MNKKIASPKIEKLLTIQCVVTMFDRKTRAQIAGFSLGLFERASHAKKIADRLVDANPECFFIVSYCENTDAGYISESEQLSELPFKSYPDGEIID